MGQTDDGAISGAHPDSTQMFRATLDAVPDAVIVVDTAGVIVTANVQVTAVFGYEPHELEGQQVEVLVPGRVRPHHPTIRSGYTQRPMGLLQLAAVRKGGREFPAEISLAAIPEGTSGPLTVATVRDITDRLRLEAEAQRVRDELLATVTHELRTPLTSIIGYAEMMADLGDDEMGPTARRMLEPLTRNATRELRLVSDLLFLAVGSLSQIKLTTESFDLRDLAQEALDEHRVEAERRGISVLGVDPGPRGDGAHALDLPGDTTTQLDTAIVADRHRLRQVLDNLIGNSLKFTPPGGSITVATTMLSDSAVITVSDDGSGIDAEEQERVFERLFRASNATLAVVQGAGLGLTIVRSIVEAHRGTVTLTSELGAGTSVTMQLPRVAPS